MTHGIGCDNGVLATLLLRAAGPKETSSRVLTYLLLTYIPILPSLKTVGRIRHGPGAASTIGMSIEAGDPGEQKVWQWSDISVLRHRIIRAVTGVTQSPFPLSQQLGHAMSFSAGPRGGGMRLHGRGKKRCDFCRFAKMTIDPVTHCSRGHPERIGQETALASPRGGPLLLLSLAPSLHGIRGRLTVTQWTSVI